LFNELKSRQIGDPMRSAIDIESLASPMVVGDVAEVLAIEQQVHTHPWSEGNFLDSLASGYGAWVVRLSDLVEGERNRQIVAYAMVMDLPDETHLLNLSVALDFQRRGIAKSLFRWLIARAQQQAKQTYLLEVRPSNRAAIELYRAIGFTQVGVRRGYYPAVNQSREDALVLTLSLKTHP
jgi:[ribosomal protein S18]-alanine N-acetyltransferase